MSLQRFCCWYQKNTKSGILVLGTAPLCLNHCLHPPWHTCSRLGKDYTRKYGELDPDSDYDNQDPYSMTVETDIMHLDDQDLKLRDDYLKLPHLTFAKLKDPNSTYPLLLPYSAVWEAMLVKSNRTCRRYVFSSPYIHLLKCFLQAIALNSNGQSRFISCNCTIYLKSKIFYPDQS